MSMFKLANNMLLLCISSMFIHLNSTICKNVYDYFVPLELVSIFLKRLFSFLVYVWLQMANDIVKRTAQHN